MDRGFRLLSLRTPTAAFYSFALCMVPFIFGCLSGAVVSLGSSEALELSAASGGFVFSEAGAVSAAGFWKLLFSTAKYHLASAFFGLSVLGIALIPALIALRGFSLVFVFSQLLRTYGADGLPLALALVALPAVFTVPSLFVVSFFSLRASARLFGFAVGRERRPARSIFVPGVFAGAAATASFLLLVTAAERFLLVRLIESAAKRVIF